MPENETKINHTPLPWTIEESVSGFRNLLATKDEFIARVDKNELAEVNESNAQFICCAVNSHYALLEAAKDFVNKVETGRARSVDSYKKFKEAIQKAEIKENFNEQNGS